MVSLEDWSRSDKTKSNLHGCSCHFLNCYKNSKRYAKWPLTICDVTFYWQERLHTEKHVLFKFDDVLWTESLLAVVAARLINILAIEMQKKHRRVVPCILRRWKQKLLQTCGCSLLHMLHALSKRIGANSCQW